ncbi:MAG: hypothetical protein M1833_002943 [Piccolia ochrophora]|nr:MAG: hypothetical protein M1833_002943 [Piccolia ochrophora]
MKPTLHIDGSHLEGGGQVLRLSLALSALTHTPLHLTDLRGNRSCGGGLKPQHLTSTLALARLCGTDVEGAERGSREIKFIPAGPNEGDASERLVEERVLDGKRVKVALSSGVEAVRLIIAGGTNVPTSPSFDYLMSVLFPMLEKIGIPPIKATLDKRDWVAGRADVGEVVFDITPLMLGSVLDAFKLRKRWVVVKVEVTVLAPGHEAQKLVVKMVTTELKERMPRTDVKVIESEDSRHKNRWYLLLVAITDSGFRLGRDRLSHGKAKDGKTGETMLVSRVVKELEEVLSSKEDCVDEYMADQLVVFQSLAKEICKIDLGSGKGANFAHEIGTLGCEEDIERGLR